jgi:hypothetical protein
MIQTSDALLEPNTPIHLDPAGVVDGERDDDDGRRAKQGRRATEPNLAGAVS